FRLHGRRIELGTRHDANGHCLHGGPGGLHSYTWRLADRPDDATAVFECHSRDGNEGFPGALTAAVSYSLRSTQLIIVLSAESDADTVVNLTNHAYFNLTGSPSIQGHRIMIDADTYTPVDGEFRPTGEIVSVAGTAFDFRRYRLLSERLRHGLTGYDHNFVLARATGRYIEADGNRAEFAASAHSPEAGLRLNVYTSQPGLQFYTGHLLGPPFSPLQGFCFEAQAFPDAPNQPAFPCALLRAGECYRQIIVYEFDIDENPDRASEPAE
ncbi:MAG: aldose epimerase family protein, partial [Pseudomonadota bacterium]